MSRIKQPVQDITKGRRTFPVRTARYNLARSAAVVALGLALPAAAQTTAVYGGSPDHIDLSVPVTASVSGRCVFSSAPSGTYDAGDIIQGFGHDFPFTVKCNTPFRVAVVSQNGGLSAPVTAPPGYTAQAPYDVSLTLVGNGETIPSNATCPAAALTFAASACIFRGPASADQGLRLDGRSSGAAGSHLRVSAPAYRGEAALVASSNYRDVLTISISASP